MGIGMALICSPDNIAEITSHFSGLGKVYRIGEVIRADNPDDAPRVLYEQ